MADLDTIGKKAMDAVRNLVKKEPLSVISMAKEGDNWNALVEVLERRAVPDAQNLIGIYKVNFDKGMGVAGYKRVEVRRKGDVGSEEGSEK